MFSSWLLVWALTLSGSIATTKVQGLIRSSNLCPRAHVDITEAAPRIASDSKTIPVRQIRIPGSSLHNGQLACKSDTSFKDAEGIETSNISVEAVQRSSPSWDFHESNECSMFLKILGTELELGQETLIICRMQNNTGVENSSQRSQQSLWLLPRMEIGILTTQDPTTVGHLDYVQILFQYNRRLESEDGSQDCLLQVQQYRHFCATTSEIGRHCGIYNCTERSKLIRLIGYQTDANAVVKYSPVLENSTSHKIVDFSVKSDNKVLKTFFFILIGSTVSGTIYAALRLYCCSRSTDVVSDTVPENHQKSSHRPSVATIQFHEPIPQQVPIMMNPAFLPSSCDGSQQ